MKKKFEGEKKLYREWKKKNDGGKKKKVLGYCFSSLARFRKMREATKKNCTIFINVHCKED